MRGSRHWLTGALNRGLRLWSVKVNKDLEQLKNKPPSVSVLLEPAATLVRSDARREEELLCLVISFTPGQGINLPPSVDKNMRKLNYVSVRVCVCISASLTCTHNTHTFTVHMSKHLTTVTQGVTLYIYILDRKFSLLLYCFCKWGTFCIFYWYSLFLIICCNWIFFNCHFYALSATHCDFFYLLVIPYRQDSPLAQSESETCQSQII